MLAYLQTVTISDETTRVVRFVKYLSEALPIDDRGELNWLGIAHAH